jgi:hypothetical protein
VFHQVHELAHVRGDRLGMQAPETRVDLCVQLADRSPACPQPLRQEPLPRPVHDIQGHADVAPADPTDIHKFLQTIQPRPARQKIQFRISYSSFGFRTSA